MGVTTQQYFHAFVIAIVEREAAEKWRDKDGHANLLTVDEHTRLLAAVAREMWASTTDVLRADVLQIVADMFCEENQKGPVIARQVRERLPNHALLVSTLGGRGGIGFDHEDFRQFFVGISLGNALVKGDSEEIRSFLRVGTVAEVTIDEAIHECLRQERDARSLVALLTAVARGELSTSFVPENVGNLVIRLVTDGESANWTGFELDGLSFGAQAMRGRRLRELTFRNCSFGPTGLAHSELISIEFSNCSFERIELAGIVVADATFVDCHVACAVGDDEDAPYFDPSMISSQLIRAGFRLSSQPGGEAAPIIDRDEELTLVEKVMRAFMRSTQHNEDTLRVRLGASASSFFDGVLPRLLDCGVFAEVPYRGSGTQRRFRLARHMSEVEEALAKCEGRFSRFVRFWNEGKKSQL
ncbi:MAG: hypothetical protein IPH76_13095 [Xanthomonadales bacterium]|nr:hypothetical protein [Xanthomonadales bacterium]